MKEGQSMRTLWLAHAHPAQSRLTLQFSSARFLRYNLNAWSSFWDTQNFMSISWNASMSKKSHNYPVLIQAPRPSLPMQQFNLQ